MFGVPGSALADLWEAVRRDPRLDAVRSTSELTAAFMANGYARASGKAGVLCTIGGPGVTFAASGLLEARHDSVPLVHLVVAESTGAELQSVAEDALLAAIAKGVYRALSPEDVDAATSSALAAACTGEPGPVVLHLTAAALSGTTHSHIGSSTSPAPDAPSDEEVASVGARLLAARRPLLFVGGGAAGASHEVTKLAELLGCPVVSTTSGRGVVSELHALSLADDAPGRSSKTLNEVVSRSDLVLALGCKLSRNGSRGYTLELPSERLVRVDSSRSAPDASYPASRVVEADVGTFLAGLSSVVHGATVASEWAPDEIAAVRQRLARGIPATLDPRVGPGRASELLSALRGCLPDDGIVATDSGLHQYYVRAHLTVTAPRTLLVPTDFQSMGFGIPAAIGAGLATGRPVVAVTGDAGFAIVGLELLSAVREGVPLTVLVLVDGYLGLIRLTHLARWGRDAGLDVAIPRLDLFARSIGVDYALLDGSRDTGELLEAAVSSNRVTILEARVGDPPDLRLLRARGLLRAASRRALGRDG